MADKKSVAFSSAVTAMGKGKAMTRSGWGDPTRSITLTEDKKRFQEPCGLGYREYKATLADAKAKDWVEA